MSCDIALPKNSWFEAVSMDAHIIYPLWCDTYSKAPEMIEVESFQMKEYIGGIREPGGMTFHIPYTAKHYLEASQKGRAWNIKISILGDIASIWRFIAVTENVAVDGGDIGKYRMMMWEVRPITEMQCEKKSTKRRKVKLK